MKIKEAFWAILMRFGYGEGTRTLTAEESVFTKKELQDLYDCLTVRIQQQKQSKNQAIQALVFRLMKLREKVKNISKKW